MGLFFFPSVLSSVLNAQGLKRGRDVGRKLPRTAALILVIVGWSTDALAAAAYFEIPKQQADAALTAFAQQANVTVLFPFDEVSKITANRLVGQYGIEEGAAVLLDGTGLTAVLENDQQLVVRVVTNSTGGSEMRKGVRGFFASLFAGVASGAAGVGDAQAQSGPQAVLDEVIVTAERRETALQDTPISIAAYDAELLEMKGVRTLEDVATFTPNLDIKPSRNSGYNSSTIQIRGLSGGAGNGERAVAMYIDGVFMPRTVGPLMKLLDMERVEVLRGPQGTLFGRNSTGGAIRVFTQQPGPDLDGYVQLTAGNFDRSDLNAMVNVPLTDTVFMRAQGGSLTEDGYVRRGSQTLGGYDESVARLQFRFEPNDNVTAALSLSYVDSESDGTPQVLGTFDMAPDLNFQGNRADWIADFLENAGHARIDPIRDPRIVRDGSTAPDWCFLDDADPDWDAACEQTNSSTYSQQDLNIQWQISDALTLTSITGLSDFEWDGINDWVMLGSEARIDHVESDMVYQEVQLNWTLADGRIDLVTGLTYFQEDVLTRDVDLDRRSTSSYSAAGGAANGNADAGVFRTGDNLTVQDSQSIGLFANLTFHLNDRLRLTPGVRRALDNKEVTSTQFASSNFNPVEGTSTTIFTEKDWNKTDWRLTLAYDISDDHMVYVTSSKAFRAGAYTYPIDQNFSGAAQTAALRISPAFVPPESVQNAEAGVRTEWFNRRLRLNLTYFDMSYSDRQGPVQQLDATSPTGYVTRTQNTGDVDITGIELDGQVVVTDTFMLDFSAGAVDPQILNPCMNNGDFFFPGPAEESFSIGGRWESGSNWAASLNYGWTGEQQTHPGGTDPVANGCPTATPGWFFDSRYEQPDYGLWNGRLRYTSDAGNWALTIFGNNLTDKYYVPYSTRSGGGFWDAANPAGVGAPLRSARTDTVGRPREYGVTFQYNFGQRVGPGS
jgi:iron complex outermembrane receptor protein